ncbi:Retrovirus-related Pol polyprotein from transposon 17.6 [Dictyocoela muelleri]|nr:Retrovirus-related Pol polyprotein from transposon 17.6 [Dictyocoela muelleri]
MPFGLSNAPRTFQRVMDTIFSKLSFVKIYLDDIIIHSKDKEDHDDHLQTVFSIINKNNIKINIQKCELYKSEIIFLEHKISKDGIQADESLISDFKFKKPNNKKGIKRILGFLNYFKSFIVNFSEKTLF